MEMLLAAALIYWGMSIVFEIIQARLEVRFGRGVARTDAFRAPRNRP
jgi:polar amino acid transport system permease protein